MKRYVLARLLQLIPILVGITFLTFGMMQFAADDAVDVMYEQTGGVSEEVKAEKRHEAEMSRLLDRIDRIQQEEDKKTEPTDDVE